MGHYSDTSLQSVSILPENPSNFSVDNVRVAKILVRYTPSCPPLAASHTCCQYMNRMLDEPHPDLFLRSFGGEC